MVDERFAELPPPPPGAADIEAARRVWLRARLAGVTEHESRLRGLRLSGTLLTIAAVDAVAVLLAISASASTTVAVVTLMTIHAGVSLTQLRA